MHKVAIDLPKKPSERWIYELSHFRSILNAIKFRFVLYAVCCY